MEGARRRRRHPARWRGGSVPGIRAPQRRRRPGYGTLTVGREGKGFIACLNDRTYKTTHYHYDVFEMREIRGGGRLKAAFASAADGRVTSVSIPLQDGTSDIVFEREEQDK